MKYATIIILLLAVAAMCYAQTPNSVQVSRWYFSGVPNIQGLTTVKDNGMPGKVWFTETDSQKLGYIVLNPCKDAKLTEYLIAPIYPYKIAYAEQAMKMQSGKSKYSSNVWFTTSTNTDTLYSLVQDRRAPFVVGFPTGDPLVIPGLLRWQVKSKVGSAKFWFTNQTWADNSVYSFESQPSAQSPFQGMLRRYIMPDAGTVMTLRVQNDYVWTTLLAETDTVFLYAMPVSGGTVLRWNLGTELGVGGQRDVQPVYNKNNPKSLELPYQVWVVSETGIAIVQLAQKSNQGADSVCIATNQDMHFNRALFSTPASMKKNTVNWTFKLTTYEPDSDYISLMHSHPIVPILRESFTIQTGNKNVNGVRHPVSTLTNTVKVTCAYKQFGPQDRDCLTEDWSSLFGASMTFNFFSQLGPVDIRGKMTATHFDLVFHEPVTSVNAGEYTSVIDWMTGDYKVFTKQNGAMMEESFPDVESPTESGFALADAYPNPFNPTTSIAYSIPTTSLVTLKVYNMLGQEVATLLNREMVDEGSHAVEFNAGSLPSGMYFCRITVNELDDNSSLNGTSHTAIKKLLLMK